MSIDIEKMKKEFIDLNKKITELESFIFVDYDYRELGMHDQAKVIKQLAGMQSYSHCLGRRISPETTYI